MTALGGTRRDGSRLTGSRQFLTLDIPPALSEDLKVLGGEFQEQVKGHENGPGLLSRRRDLAGAGSHKRNDVRSAKCAADSSLTIR